MNSSSSSSYSDNEEDAENEEDQIFSCRIENSKIVTDILNAIHAGGREQDHQLHLCEVKASEKSLVFSVLGRAKSTQARATLPAELFEEYIFESRGPEGRENNLSERDRVVQFSINLTVLLDCMQLFGSSSESTSATMTYSNLDASFKISLEESGVLTTCDIATLEPDDVYAGLVTPQEARNNSLYAQFRQNPETCRLILRADPLRDAMQEMCDVLGGGDVTFFVVNNPEESFKMQVKGSLDFFEVEFPKTSGAFVLFQCSSESKFSYLNPSVQLGMKALSISKETYIRINSEGLMSIQHQIKDRGKPSEPYIDFFILPAEDAINGLVS